MFHSFGKRGIALIILAALLLVVAAGCGQKAAGPSPGTESGQQPSGQPGGQAGGSQPAAQVIELKLAHTWPTTHYVEVEFVQKWIREVAARTGNRVKINSYPAQTLLKAADTYDGVVKGIADIGIGVYAYTPGKFPVIEALMIPGISYNSAKVASKVATEVVEKLNPRELQDTKHLMVFTTGPGGIMSKTPIRSLKDLKGMEIGVTAGPRVRALELLGATPVAIPMPEMYEALSKGVIKGVLSGTEVLKGYRLGELVNYVTETPFLYNQVFYMVMNLNKWNSLPPDIQQAITEVTRQFDEQMMSSVWDTLNAEGLKWAQQQRKIEVITLPENEKRVWEEKLSPMLQEYRATLDSKGLPGEQIMSLIQQLAEKYNAQYQ